MALPGVLARRWYGFWGVYVCVVSTKILTTIRAGVVVSHFALVRIKEA